MFYILNSIALHSDKNIFALTMKLADIVFFFDEVQE